MLENPVLTATFIVAVVSFFKAQFDLTGRWALLAAFCVALVIALIPVISASVPVIEPWLTPIVDVVVLFLGAAGSFDFVMEVRDRV